MTDLITFTAIDGSTVTPRTRADLMQHPAFADLETDTEGNPCVWCNCYSDGDDREWTSEWSCQCDDDGFEPFQSTWMPICDKWNEDGSPADEAYLLWERLPEKGDKEGEAAYGAMLASKEFAAQADALQSRRETATILAALRFYQSYITVSRFAPPSTWDISTDNGTIKPLTQSEIDELCEKING